MHKVSVIFVLISFAHFLNAACKRNSVSSKKEEQKVSFQYSALDTNLLSQTLLKIGAELKAHVVRTKQEITHIFQELDNFNHSLTESLEKIALNEKYGKDLMKRVHRLETGNEYRLFAELQKQLAEATDHRNVFDSKLTFLEKKVEAILNYKINGETSTNITAIMTYLKNQSKRTDALLSEVEQQQEQTDFQDTLIQKLLKKVESLSKRTKHSKFSIATKKMRDSSKEQS